MHYTYVLQSEKDGQWYTGCTQDLRSRLEFHNSGKVTATRDRRPLHLIYYEACHNKEDAYAREKYFKSGMGKRYMRNRLKRFLTG